VIQKRVEILGVPVDRVSEEEALAWIEVLVKDGRPHQVVTVNPEFVVSAQKNEDFSSVLRQADLCLPDGVGLLWAARYLGCPLKGRVAGVDMVRGIAGLASKKGYGLFLLGAAEGVAEATGSKLQENNPGLKIVGTYAGSPALDEEEAVVSMVREAQPQILFVAYGAPQQDIWIYRNLHRLGVSVAMGVGGAFDFISGKATRAPKWMRRLGLEWLHRLVREPWRWRRMSALPRFVLLVLTRGR
jgi:N-acetylglucosaminyldiphosphoundecaprenol N-acetyl-beta-D-mannosaminyltransferase